MKLSAIVLAVYFKEKHYRITKECLGSLNNVDEMILVECGERVSDFKVDIKIHIRESIGNGAKAWNLGAKLASGDYVALICNDIKIVKGNLKDLCKPNTATSPLMNNKPPDDDLWGSFMVVPAEIHQRIGMLDERYEYSYTDTDYIRKLKEAGIKMECVRTVGMSHPLRKGETLSRLHELGIDVVRKQGEDKIKFEEKWRK